MSTKIAAIVLILALAASACAAQSVSGPKSIQITVYSGGFALVKDTRGVNLVKGNNSIEVEDVAARIDPTSVLFKSITAPNSVSILEQNYQYDLISPDNILKKSVGKVLAFTSFDSNGKPYIQAGTLLNPAGQNELVIKGDDGSLVLRPQGQVAVQSMPEGLHPRPTLNWLLASDIAGEQQTEISYITDGVGWKADYVVLVNKDDTKLDLSGWVTMNNTSGAAYKDAKLTLIAGDVRRIQPVQQRRGGYGDVYAMDSMAAAPQFQEKSFFEYHMYTMARPTTISDNETKQLALLGASNVPVKKDLVYDGRQAWWRNWWYPGQTGHPGQGYDTSNYHKVNVTLEVKNSKENSMGMPLPKGKVRVYKLDDDGSQQYVGEDEIDHTPKDEKLRLYIGDAFDIVGDYKVASYRQVSKNVVEEDFEVSVRNHKETPVTVRVIDHVWSDWKVTKSSTEHTKTDAHTIEFPVKVAANGETKVTYTIRTAW